MSNILPTRRRVQALCVSAAPMTRGEYAKLHGVPVLEGQSEDDEGYIVEYPYKESGKESGIGGARGTVNWFNNVEFEFHFNEHTVREHFNTTATTHNDINSISQSEGFSKSESLDGYRFIDKHISENSCYKTDGEALVNKMLDTIIADSSYGPNFNLMGALLLAEQKGVSSICKFNGTEIAITPELIESSRWRIIEPTKPRTVVKKDIDMMINHSQIEYVHTGDKLTSCIVTLPTGFIITGESLCADKNNFNKELGEKYSLEKAIDKVWEHENYAAALEFYNSKK